MAAYMSDMRPYRLLPTPFYTMEADVTSPEALQTIYYLLRCIISTLERAHVGGVGSAWKV